MAATGLNVFDRTLQTTNIWLNEIQEEIGPDEQRAWHVLGAVLRALRDRLQPDLAAHLGAQLPLLVRGLYYDQFRPSQPPDRSRSVEEFLERIGEGLAGVRPVDRREAMLAVFRVLGRHVTHEQIRKVQDALPQDLRAAWQGVTAT
jgi:uncharacterized protein (DUF2267 family)